MTVVRVAPAGAAYADMAAQHIEHELERCLLTRVGATLGLAGGGTPRPVYERLAERAAARPDDLWSRIGFFFGDERAVPYDHPASNYRMAREALLDHLPKLSRRNVHPMPVLEDRAKPVEYRGFDLDVLLVGVGDDGHILSLFPGSPLLEEGGHELVAWAEAPVLPVHRLTLTPRALRSCRTVLVLVTGARKVDVVRSVLTDAPCADELPAYLVRHGTWLLDEPAASRLPPDLFEPATRSPEAP